MDGSAIRITLVTIRECEPCNVARDLVERFVADNRSLGIEVQHIDGIDDADELVQTRASDHPTLILDVAGDERARLSGSLSSRKVLRRLLPVLYADDQLALAKLRQQLGSETEEFPTGPLRGRVRQAEKLELVRGVPMFRGLGRRHLTQLARLADEIHRAGGDLVIEEGQSGDEFFIVVEGAVDVSKRGQTVASLSAGEWFGEMSLFDDLPRSATVVATAPTTMLAIHRNDFDYYLLHNPAIMRTLLTTMSRRLR